MNKKYYCQKCNKMMDSEVVERLETLSIRGEVIQLKVKMRVCKECGEPLADDELDDISLKQFYDEYRRKNNLLFPNEIKKIREKYNMSQTEFAKLLGMEEKTITRYENGTIQERTHDNLIRAVNNNFVFSDFITREKKSNVSDLKNYEIKGDELYFNLEKIEQQKVKCFAFKKSNILESKKKYAEIKLCA